MSLSAAKKNKIFPNVKRIFITTQEICHEYGSYITAYTYRVRVQERHMSEPPPSPQLFKKKFRLKSAVKFFTADFSLKRFFLSSKLFEVSFPLGNKNIFMKNVFEEGGKLKN